LSHLIIFVYDRISPPKGAMSLETIENICWICDIFTVWFINSYFWWI